MAQEPNRSENRQPRLGNRPGNNDDPNAPKKGPRFSIYWIYAIIFAVLIGFQLFGPFSPNMAKISSLKFREMLQTNNGDIAKYVVIDNRKTVKIYLTPQGKARYADMLKKNISGKISEEGPHMYIKITSGESFEKEMSDFYNKHPEVKEVTKLSDSERDWLGGDYGSSSCEK
jgi:AFG3 family protein